MSEPSEFPRTLKMVTVWCLIALALFLGFSEYQRRATQPAVRLNANGEATLSLPRGLDGHYRLSGTLNGESVEFLLDTGASMTSIPAELARSLSLPIHSSAQFSTANGTVVADIVLADLRIAGAFEIDRLRVAALPSMKQQALLGMDVLSRFRITQEAGMMQLRAAGR